MAVIDPRMRSWLIWFAPAILIALLLGWETEWGHALKRVPQIAAAGKPQPVVTALLPEYKLDGGIEARRETVDRTLFNPTRRSAPPPPQTAGATPAFARGQFTLMGTTVVGDKATAFLREVNGGRSRRVQRGETVNGMLVAEVAPDHVKLTLGDDAEELTLKVAAGPRATIQPQPPAPQAGAAPAPFAQAGAPVMPQVQDVAQVLAERRRAARAAEAAAAARAPPAVPGPAASAPSGAPVTTPAPRADPAWNDVYQRYMQPRK